MTQHVIMVTLYRRWLNLILENRLEMQEKKWGNCDHEETILIRTRVTGGEK